MANRQGHTFTRTPKQSPAYRCLAPLLNALNWQGSSRHLCEVLPDSQAIDDFWALREVLGNLHYRTIPYKSDPRLLSEEELPALLSTPDGDIWVIIEIEQPGRLKVFKSSKSRLDTCHSYDLKGSIHLVRPVYEAELETEHRRLGWIKSLHEHEKKYVYELFGISFLINGLALALPVYMLTAYDLAIGDGSMPALIMLAGVAAIILAAEITLRELRNRSVARIATRVHTRIMETVFDRIIRQPLGFVENAPLSKQLNKLRAFESLGKILRNPLAVSLLDLLFIPIFITASFAIGAWLGWLMTGFIGVLTIFLVIYIPKYRQRSRNANIKRLKTHLFRKEMIANLAIIQCSAAEHIWEKRYSGYIAQQLVAESDTQHLGFTEQTLTQTFSAMTVVLIVGLGMTGVIADQLSIGALVAVIVILWRVLIPIQAVLANLTQMFQAVDLAKQLDQLIQRPREGSKISTPAHQKIAGRIELENVAYRGHTQMQPALRNISMTIEPGKLVVLSGTESPSRSILLRLIANLYQPNKGCIRIDGFDAGQFDTRRLRQRVALVSNDQPLFSGSLAYNFWLVNPLADENAILNAIRDADLEKFLSGLNEGLDTCLTDCQLSGLDAATYQKIRLARAYIQDPAIYLFDEPVRDLDPTGHRAFLNKLTEIKGKTTALIKTSDADIYNIADKAVHLQAGQIIKLDINARAFEDRSTDRLRALLNEQDTERASRSFKTALSRQ